MNLDKYTKSPLTYMGGKYSLLNFVIPKFPKECVIFIDLFGGSGVVLENYNNSKLYLYNEKDKNIFEIMKWLFKNSYENIISDLNEIQNKYNLLQTLDHENQKKNYLILRNDYNEGNKTPQMLYMLSRCSINNLIRFNSSGGFNTSFGKIGYSKNTIKMIKEFKDKISNKSIGIDNIDYEEYLVYIYDYSKPKDFFIYIDPPYLGTDTEYNKKWLDEDDIKLFNHLDKLNELNCKWALSNVIIHNGIEHKTLNNWIEQNKNKYNVYTKEKEYSPFFTKNQGKSSIEVLITNYKEVE